METLLGIAGPILSKAQQQRPSATCTKTEETVARHVVPGGKEHVSSARMAKFREEDEEC